MTKVGNAERVHVGHVPSGEPNGNPKLALQVSHLTAEPWFADVSFSASPGEVIGIAGVQGSGHGHLLRAIAGVDEIDEGTVRIGRRLLRRGSIRQSFECGMLLVPADRRRAGIVPTMSVRDNIIFSGRVRKLCRRFGLRWPVHKSTVAQYYARELNVRPLGNSCQDRQSKRRQSTEGSNRSRFGSVSFGPFHRRANSGHRCRY